jgi:lysophospholipase L1-like esterase
VVARRAAGVAALAGLVALVVGGLAAGCAGSAGRSAAGATTSGGELRVVGLGDSAMTGTACGCAPYVELAATGIAAERGLAPVVANLAIDGATVDDVAGGLGDPATRTALAAADLVVVTVGANDFDPDRATDDDCAPPALACYRTDLEAQEAALTSLLDGIVALLPADGVVLVTGYWNVFLDGDVGRAQGDAYVATSDALTAAWNSATRRAADRSGAVYVDLYGPFRGDGSRDDTALLDEDGDHASPAGHAVVAEALSRAYDEVAPAR